MVSVKQIHSEKEIQNNLFRDGPDNISTIYLVCERVDQFNLRIAVQIDFLGPIGEQEMIFSTFDTSIPSIQA